MVGEPGGPTHYDVLGVQPGATPEEIERAYRLCIELYREDSLATYSLLDPEEQRAALSRVEAAYRVLRDDRPAYDRSLLPRPEASSSSDDEAMPRGERILPSPVTGEALRRFREKKGVTLEEIATQSKVSRRFLQYIEEDRHAQLPARVYLRGFLQQYARAVGLEPSRTAEAYMARLPKPS